jgi:hypothetical protein
VDAGDQLMMAVHWRERDWVHLREVIRDEEPSVRGTLAACGLLKFFDYSLLWVQEYLFQFLISMWSIDQQCFIVQGEQLTFSVIEDVYFLTGLPFRGSPLPVEPVLLGDGQLADLVWTYCTGQEFMSGLVVRIVYEVLVRRCKGFL